MRQVTALDMQPANQKSSWEERGSKEVDGEFGTLAGGRVGKQEHPNIVKCDIENVEVEMACG